MKHRIDIVNFFLIWFTLAIAIQWPFELFLFSYIVLGPLHYLTEINWLDKQHYFLHARDSRGFLWSMVVLVLLLSVFTILPETQYWSSTRSFHDNFFKPPNDTLRHVLQWNYMLVVLAFVMAAAWVFTSNWILRVLVVVFCLLCSLMFYTNPTLAIVFGVLLPTIFHVFFFTIIFMLYGTLKSRSVWGYLNVASMLLVLAVIAVSHRVVVPGSLGDSVVELTIASSFQSVNLAINRFLGSVGSGGIDAYSTAFWRVQSFIAFAYTYHYLNWFSKTSIIKWHQVEKRKLVFSAVLWLTSIGLYKIDYRLGFAAITAVSVLHIVLEFPLNFISMKGVFGVVMRPKKPAPILPRPSTG
jgi:hypothetical protein